MKKKLLALVLVLALAASALSLAACGSDFASMYVNPYEKDADKVNAVKVLDSKADLGLNAFAANVAGNCNLSVFTAQDENDNNVYKVYNYETNAVVLTLTESETVTYNVNVSAAQANGTYYDVINVRKTTAPAQEGDNPKIEFELYNFDGTKALSYDATKAQVGFIDCDSTVFVDGDYYRFDKNGKLVKAGSIAKNVAAQLIELDFDEVIDGNYYYYDTEEGSAKLYVYDSSFKLICFYETPAYSNIICMRALNNGKVLIQYAYEVPEFESDYTVFFKEGQQAAEEGKKYKIITELYNVKKGAAKEIETVGIFSYVESRSSGDRANVFECLDKDIENIGLISFITDKQLDTNAKTVSIKNDGSIDKVLHETFIAQDGEPNTYSSGAFTVYTKTGSLYLIDKKGNIVADITGNTAINEKYILLDGKVYDHDFKELVTIDEDKWEFFGEMNNSFVFRCIDEKDENAAKKFKLFANGSMKDITLADGESLAGSDSRYYVVEKNADTTTYIYYNENGEKIFDTTVLLSNKGTTRNGKVLLSGSKWDETAGKTVYTNVVLYAK